MNKLKCCLALSLAALTLTACGGGTPTPSESKPQESESSALPSGGSESESEQPSKSEDPIPSSSEEEVETFWDKLATNNLTLASLEEDETSGQLVVDMETKFLNDKAMVIEDPEQGDMGVLINGNDGAFIYFIESNQVVLATPFGDGKNLGEVYGLPSDLAALEPAAEESPKGTWTIDVNSSEVEVDVIDQACYTLLGFAGLTGYADPLTVDNIVFYEENDGSISFSFDCTIDISGFEFPWTAYFSAYDFGLATYPVVTSYLQHPTPAVAPTNWCADILSWLGNDLEVPFPSGVSVQFGSELLGDVDEGYYGYFYDYRATSAEYNSLIAGLVAAGWAKDDSVSYKCYYTPIDTDITAYVSFDFDSAAKMLDGYIEIIDESGSGGGSGGGTGTLPDSEFASLADINAYVGSYSDIKLPELDNASYITGVWGTTDYNYSSWGDYGYYMDFCCVCIVYIASETDAIAYADAMCAKFAAVPGFYYDSYYDDYEDDNYSCMYAYPAYDTSTGTVYQGYVVVGWEIFPEGWY